MPDLLAVRAAAPAGRRALYDRWTRGYDGSAEARLAQQDAGSAGWRRPTRCIYAIVLTLVAFDGIMALQPHWFSNLLGGFFFMGVVPGRPHAARADDDLRRVAPRRRPTWSRPSSATISGKLCFGFTVFWTYLMWAQFLVIWYGNLPEETGFVFARLWGHWLPVGKAVLIGMFIIPFFGLLGVAPEEGRGSTLGFFATVSLVALWLERYLLVMPSVTRAAGAGVRAARGRARRCSSSGLYLLTYALFARTFPMISPAPGGDHAGARARPRQRADLGRVRPRGEPEGLRAARVDRAAGASRGG